MFTKNIYVLCPRYDVKLVCCYPEYDVKLIWCYQGNDIVSFATFCTGAIYFLCLYLTFYAAILCAGPVVCFLYNIFHCRKCLEGEHGLFQSVLLKEVVSEPNVKLECVPKFCYLGDTLGVGGGVEEAAKAKVRCAWAKFKESYLLS